MSALGICFRLIIITKQYLLQKCGKWLIKKSIYVTYVDKQFESEVEFSKMLLANYSIILKKLKLQFYLE